MHDTSYRNLFYPERIKWIHQQLKSGKELAEILDIDARPYQQTVLQPVQATVVDLPENETDTLFCEINHEVRQRWDTFTSLRMENPEALFSMALQEFMANHV